MKKKQLKLFSKKNISSMTLSHLKQLISNQQYIEKSTIEELKNDSRKGTTKLAEQCIQKNKKLKKEKERI